jgi:hypothetical protein
MLGRVRYLVHNGTGKGVELGNFQAVNLEAAHQALREEKLRQERVKKVIEEQS